MKTIADLVGKNIRTRRVALGLSQTALAKLAKISNITLNRIENGKQAPQGASLTMIAEALGCSEADLYGSARPAQKTAPDILEAIERGVAETLSKDDIEMPDDIREAMKNAQPHHWIAIRAVFGLPFQSEARAPQKLRRSKS